MKKWLLIMSFALSSLLLGCSSDDNSSVETPNEQGDGNDGDDDANGDNNDDDANDDADAGNDDDGDDDGGDSDSGDDNDAGEEKIGGLSLKEVVIVTPNRSGVGSNSADPRIKAFDDPDTDYTLLSPTIHTWELALEPLDTVNQIICYINQARIDAVVNQSYTVLVDTEQCQQEQGDSNSDRASGSEAREFELWTVQSTRESNTAPQTIRIWVPGEASSDPRQAQRILVEITIDGEQTEENPVGSFTMNWRGIADINGNEVDTMQGTIQAFINSDNQPNVLFFQSGGGSAPLDYFFSEASNILLDDITGNSGVAKTSSASENDSVNFAQEFQVAYNEDYYLREKDDGSTEQVCSSRDQFIDNIWRYNLYDFDTGALVDLDSGFPFEVTVNNETYYGHVGYFGIWVPDEVNVEDLTTVTRQNTTDNSETVYDVVNAPGRLIMRSKSKVPLSELDGQEFILFDGFDFLVEYTADLTLNDGTEVSRAGFYKLGALFYSESGRQIEPFTPPILVEEQYLSLWSEALGGNVNYDELSSPTAVFVFAQEYVTRTNAERFGSATVIQFDCYFKCLKANISTAQINFSGDSPYYPDSTIVGEPAATYTFSFSDLTLRDPENNPVALAGDTTVDPFGAFGWGIDTGAMVLSGTVLTDVYAIWNQEVSFKWETGPNEWNRYTAVKEQGSNEIEQFDQPLSFIYTHSEASDANAALTDSVVSDGQTYLLNYAGPGEFWGIPYETTDNLRYYPIFSIANGTQLSSSAGNFVLKAVAVEQRMAEVDTSQCSTSGLDLSGADALTLPDQNSITPVTITWADRPIITDPPLVIDGELQQEEEQ